MSTNDLYKIEISSDLDQPIYMKLGDNINLNSLILLVAFGNLGSLMVQT